MPILEETTKTESRRRDLVNGARSIAVGGMKAFAVYTLHTLTRSDGSPFLVAGQQAAHRIKTSLQSRFRRPYEKLDSTELPQESNLKQRIGYLRRKQKR